jgi:23S rRNA pseudouridine2605 synthase
VRLNKFIAHNSRYSRREADRLIESGVVKVNKKIVKDFSYRVEREDNISIRDRAVKRRVPNSVTVVVYNKPKGVLVTKRDDRGRTTIYHLLPGKFRHFIPIGRLDFASEGVLLLTDNSEVAETLMKSSLPRVYNIKIDKPLSKKMIEGMKNGLELSDASKGAHEKSGIERMSISPFESFELRGRTGRYTKLRVTINEGKNRELRRFFGYFGANVLDLKRVAFWNIELNSLPENKTRYLTKKEYENLHKFLKEQR